MPRPAPRETPRRSPLTPFYVVLGLVVLAGVVLLGRQVMGGSKKQGAVAPVPVVLSPEQLQRVPGISMGQTTAPITIYEFADFQCPHCGQWAAFVEPLIRQNLVNTGKVRYVFYEFPLPQFKFGFLAARAGRCANEQGKFWEFHDYLFAHQQEWAYAKDAADNFVEYAKGMGMNGDTFEQCVRSEKYASEVSQSQKLGETLGVQGTPTLFANGQKLDPLPDGYSALEARLRQIAPAAFAAGGAAAPAGAAPAGAAPAPAGAVTGTTPAQP